VIPHSRQEMAVSDELSDSAFDHVADKLLNGLLDQMADLEDESLDVELESGVLTIAFDTGVKYVVNSHRAARQIWASADSTAWHFEPRNGQWISTKTKEDLYDVLEERLSNRLGRRIHLKKS
jgi:CyaY protein